MKKSTLLWLVIAAAGLLLEAPLVGYAQRTKPRPKTSTAKPKVPPKAVQTEEEIAAEFQMKLLKTAFEPETWKEHTFAPKGFKAAFPRTPIPKDETYRDPMLGAFTMTYYTAIGDNGVFVIGSMDLPLIAKNKSLRNSFYEGMASGLLKDGDYEVKETRDITINGKNAIEYVAVDKTTADDAIFRFFLDTNRVYMMMAMTAVTETAKPDEKLAEKAAAKVDMDRFFASFQPISAIAPVNNPLVPPQFRGVVTDRIYRSEFFNFTIRMPEGWVDTSDEDLSGMRAIAKNLIENNSSMKVSSTEKERRRLFSFAAKPMGSDDNDSLACNITKMPAAPVKLTTKDLASGVEKMMGSVKIYTVTQTTRPVTVGENSFYSFDLKGTIGENSFEQSVFMMQRKGYLLMFMLTYDQFTKDLVMNSLRSLTFEGP